MTEEIVFVVDENDNPIVGGLPRSEVIKKNLWRRVSGGIVFDMKREIILAHQRSYMKDERPGVWVCTFGGKVQEKEDSLLAAERELFEEFRIKNSMAKVCYFNKYKSLERRQFEYLFFFFIDSQACNILRDDLEVKDTKWIEIYDIYKLLENNKDWYSYGYEKDMIKEAMNVWKKV